MAEGVVRTSTGLSPVTRDCWGSPLSYYCESDLVSLGLLSLIVAVAIMSCIK